MEVSTGLRHEIARVQPLANDLASGLVGFTPDPLVALQQHTGTSYVHRDLRNMRKTQMSLPALCEKIRETAALTDLKVIGSECYVMHTLVRHRYLLLELSLGRGTVWMRLDRCRSLMSILAFVFASSKGPANDTVQTYSLLQLVGRLLNSSRIPIRSRYPSTKNLSSTKTATGRISKYVMLIMP